jgi:hypothetical protein
VLRSTPPHARHLVKRSSKTVRATLPQTKSNIEEQLA